MCPLVLRRGTVRARPEAGAGPLECRVDTDLLSSEQKPPYAEATRHHTRRTLPCGQARKSHDPLSYDAEPSSAHPPGTPRATRRASNAAKPAVARAAHAGTRDAPRDITIGMSGNHRDTRPGARAIVDTISPIGPVENIAELQSAREIVIDTRATPRRGGHRRTTPLPARM